MFTWPISALEMQMCRDKFQYKTRSEARRVGRLRTRVEGLPKLRIYTCPFCTYYHHAKRRRVDD